MPLIIPEVIAFTSTMLNISSYKVLEGEVTSEYFEIQIRKDEKKRGTSAAHRPLYRIILKGDPMTVAYADDREDIMKDWGMLMEMVDELPPCSTSAIASELLRAKVMETVLSQDANVPLSALSSSPLFSSSSSPSNEQSSATVAVVKGFDPRIELPESSDSSPLNGCNSATPGSIGPGVYLTDVRMQSNDNLLSASSGKTSFDDALALHNSLVLEGASNSILSDDTVAVRRNGIPRRTLSATSSTSCLANENQAFEKKLPHQTAMSRNLVTPRSLSQYPVAYESLPQTKNRMLFVAPARQTLGLLVSIIAIFHTLSAFSGSRAMMLTASMILWLLVILIHVKIPKDCSVSTLITDFTSTPNGLIRVASLFVDIVKVGKNDKKQYERPNSPVSELGTSATQKKHLKSTPPRGTKLPVTSAASPSGSRSAELPSPDSTNRNPHLNSSYFQYPLKAGVLSANSRLPQTAPQSTKGNGANGPTDPLPGRSLPDLTGATKYSTTPGVSDEVKASPERARMGGESLFGVRAVPLESSPDKPLPLLTKRAPSAPTKYYLEASGTNFTVRGPSYLVDRKKVKSGASILEFCGIDMFSSPTRPDHIASKLTLPIPPSLLESRGISIPQRGLNGSNTDTKQSLLTPEQESALRKELLEPPSDGLAFPQYLVVQFMYPDYSPGLISVRPPDKCSGYGLVMYFALVGERRKQLVQALGLSRSQPANEETERKYHSSEGLLEHDPQLLSCYAQLLQKFGESDLTSTSSSMKGRLKAIPRILNLDDLDLGLILNRTLRTKNETPFLTGPIHQRWFQGQNYLEVDVDLHEYTYAARAVAANIIPYIKDFKFDLGFVIEGRSDEDLPEVCLGAVEFSHIELPTVPSLQSLTEQSTDKDET